ncbi:MAG: SAM-dependent methyltransferase [Chloroflexi bacterium]|nr:SAM-dependent methyltransferase [Chloroflexota bacterium]
MPVEQLIRERIQATGRITFAEFMEIALYAEGGYYTRPGRISALGDFYTSPSVHPMFGALICVQLREMWASTGRPVPFDVIEFGAGDGTLASDITGYAARLDPSFSSALRYRSVDRALSSSPPRPPRIFPEGYRSVGCVLSNELLDAMPVHRFTVQGGKIRELYVCLRDGNLVEQPGAPSNPAIEQRLTEVRHRLPEGFVGEVNLAIDKWADDVKATLDRGFVVTIDFGYPRDELYSSPRSGGTLRCYYRHTVSADPLRRIGEQDIAAHVDFTALDQSLGHRGFSPLGITTQARFLERLGARDMVRRLSAEFHTARDIDLNRAAMLELLKPEGLGGFKVAIHARDAGRPPLTGLGLAYGAPAASLPLPLLEADSGRVPVFEGRYPYQARELELTWDEIIRKGTGAQQ